LPYLLTAAAVADAALTAALLAPLPPFSGDFLGAAVDLEDEVSDGGACLLAPAEAEAGAGPNAETPRDGDTETAGALGAESSGDEAAEADAEPELLEVTRVKPNLARLAAEEDTEADFLLAGADLPAALRGMARQLEKRPVDRMKVWCGTKASWLLWG